MFVAIGYASYAEDERFIVLEIDLNSVVNFEEGSQYSVAFLLDFSTLDTLNSEGDYVSFYTLNSSDIDQGNVLFDAEEGSCNEEASLIDYYANHTVYLEFNYTESEPATTPVYYASTDTDKTTASPVYTSTAESSTFSPYSTSSKFSTSKFSTSSEFSTSSKFSTSETYHYTTPQVTDAG